MNNFKKIAAFVLLIISSVSAFAQEEAPIEMANGLYQSGKIYVVVGVIAIIFVGIIIYLISIDRKVGKLEKEIKSNK